MKMEKVKKMRMKSEKHLLAWFFLPDSPELRCDREFF